MQCKKKLFLLAVVFIMLFAILVPDAANVVNAKTKQSTIKKTYASYIKKNAENDLGYTDNLEYYFQDFNNDGIPEMVVASVGGARAAIYVYTYYKGKAVMAHAGDTFFNEVGCLKSKNYFVGFGSGGASYSEFTLYKLKKGKLHEVATYVMDEGKFTKNGKKISEKQYTKAYNKVNWSFNGKIHKLN